jgi:hypothetical protein
MHPSFWSSADVKPILKWSSACEALALHVCCLYVYTMIILLWTILLKFDPNTKLTFFILRFQTRIYFTKNIKKKQLVVDVLNYFTTVNYSCNLFTTLYPVWCLNDILTDGASLTWQLISFKKFLKIEKFHFCQILMMNARRFWWLPITNDGCHFRED